MKIDQIELYFKEVDKVIFEVFQQMDIQVLQPERDTTKYFQKLCRDIIAQQLAGKAAEAINNRFVELFEEDICPEVVLDMPEQTLRDIGLSWAKVRYTKDLAIKANSGEVDLNNLSNLTDEQVIAELTKVKGIGNWTAEMFLIFTLGREDVFSHGDLGLRKGLIKLYNLSDKPTADEIDKIVTKWQPYRSYGSLALWEGVDQ